MSPNGNMTEVYERVEPSTARPIAYSGFPWWHALLVSPARETKAADLLKTINVFVYFPHFTVHKNCRGRLHTPVRRAVIPGILLAPVEMMEIKRRDEVFDFCGVRGFIRNAGGMPARLSKAAIEVIREMEAKLYIPPPPDPGADWDGKIGDTVTFKNDVYCAYFGDVVVTDVDHYPRIKVRGVKLFGCPQDSWTTASEIVAK